MGWCIGPGARVWRGVKPPAHLVPSKSCKNPVFGRFLVSKKKSPYFDYPTMLAVSGGLAPSFLSSPVFFQNPQKVPVKPDFVFFRKKSWAKMAISSPGPNVDRSRPNAGPSPAPGQCAPQFPHNVAIDVDGGQQGGMRSGPRALGPREGPKSHLGRCRLIYAYILEN